MKLIYVAGPYRAPTERGVAENIQRAEALAAEVWKLGAACICPHKNTAFMGGVVPDQMFLDGDLEMLRRCDAVICAEGWRDSFGACGEVLLANSIGVRVFDDFDSLKQWLKESP